MEVSIASIQFRRLALRELAALGTSVSDAGVASFAGRVVALEEMPFGAGRIDRFVSAELILVLVAGTIGGDAGRLLQTDISTSSWSE